MQIRSLFTAFPKGKWKASKSMPRAILLLLISQAFNSEKTLSIQLSCEKSEQSPLTIQKRSSKRGKRTLNSPEHHPQLPHPWDHTHPGCTRIHGKLLGGEEVLRIYSLTRLPTTFTWSPHLPLRTPSCGNTRIRVTNSGNFDMNFLPYWRKSQLVACLGLFKQREKQMPICQV